MPDVAETLRRYILEKYLPGESSSNLHDDTPLQTSGILDSLAVLGLGTFVEQRYGLQLTAAETGIDSFDTIEDIVRLIARKRQPATA
jgi:acyl carrier protein